MNLTLITRRIAIVSCALLLSGCGFALRGYDHPNLPFNRVMIVAGSEIAGTRLQDQVAKGSDLRNNVSIVEELRYLVLSQPGVEIVEKAPEAQVVLQVISQRLERTVVAFSSAGRPREIELRMRVMFRVTDGFSVELSTVQEIMQTRNISVSESETLAITSAEDFMRTDMQRDIARQIIRRLRAVKPRTP